jgi:hypothetical protein
MKIALVHNHYDPDHLAEVIEEMKTLGAPVIKAVWMEVYNHWAALEGCHRIRAAKALGLVPEIEEVEYSDELVEGMQDDVTVEQIADSSRESEVVEFNAQDNG